MRTIGSSKSQWIVVAISLVAWSMDSISTERKITTKQLEDRTAKLPIPDGFESACETDNPVRRLIINMTANSAQLLACFVESKTFAEVKEGKAVSTYPLIVLNRSRASELSPMTRQDFEAMKTTEVYRIDRAFDSQRASVKDQMKARDAILSKDGVEFKREITSEQFSGVYEARPLSFSSVLTHEIGASVDGQSRVLHETQVVSAIYYFGNLLILMVVDDAKTSPNAGRARQLTSNWLDAFHDLNRQ